MKIVFVTGADGFIGSHLVDNLLRGEYIVKALSLYNSENSTGNLKYINKHTNLEIVKGDIRDLSMMIEYSKGCDAIVNLAALIGIPYSYSAVKSYIDTNITGTYNILESAKLNDIKHTIIMSTSEIYGSAQYTPMDENHPLNAMSPYAATKIAGEQLALSYYRAFGINVTVARPFNVFGPRQSLRSVIPTVISQIIAGRRLKLGNIHTKRDFTYVTDTACALSRMILNEKTYGKSINICSGASFSIKDIAEMLLNISGKKIAVSADKARIRSKSSEVDLLLGDPSYAKRILKYSPSVDFKNGLEMTYQWFVENIRNYDSDEYVK